MSRVAEDVVTVVIPTRNRLRFLQATTESVLTQSTPAELIVVVDDSQDGTEDWLATLSEPRIKVIVLGEHSERSRARNSGLTAASGSLILFIDDDDKLAPGALEALSKALQRHPSTVAAVGRTLIFDDDGQQRANDHPSTTIVRDVSREVMLGWAIPPGSSLFRTAAVREAGGWPTGLSQAEDQDLWLRISRIGPVAIIPDVVLHYRRHRGQTRPADTYEIERMVRQRFIDNLSSDEKPRAEAVLAAREHHELGVMAWRSNNLRLAFKHFLASVFAAPGFMLFSPISRKRTRSYLLRSGAGMLIGPRLTAKAQRSFLKRREQRGRAPGGHDPLLPMDPYSEDDSKGA